MAPDLSRRTMIQATAAIAAATLLPDVTFASPPALDLEELFGWESLARVRSRYRDNHYHQGVGEPRPVPGLFAPDGRFGMSTPTRYGLAKYLADGEDVLFRCPKEAINCDQLVLHLFRKHIYQLPYPLQSIYGPLRAPPHDDAILITKEEHLYFARVNPTGVPQFQFCRPI
jgi:hypothetical protein